MNFMMIYRFLSERTKIKWVEKLGGNLLDEKEYVIHQRNLKVTLNHKLVLKKVYRNIKFTVKTIH